MGCYAASMQERDERQNFLADGDVSSSTCMTPIDSSAPLVACAGECSTIDPPQRPPMESPETLSFPTPKAAELVERRATKMLCDGLGSRASLPQRWAF